MARLFSDEDFPLPVVRELRRLGHDVLTVHDIGKANQRWLDDEVLAYARTEGRGVLTLNRLHFRRLHRSYPDHAGLILCTRDADFSALAERIHQAITSIPTLRGQLVRVYRPAR